MEHVERVLMTLKHKEPDRIPIDLGSVINGMHHVALRKLLKFMDMGDVEILIIDKMQGLGKIPDFILEHFDVDFRHVFVNPPKLNEVRYISEDKFIDEFGITYERHGYYFEIVEGLQPLYNARSPKDIENYSLPAIKDYRVRGMGKIAKMYNEAGYAVVINGATAGIWELAERLHGMSNCLKNLILNPELMESLLDLTLEIHKRFWELILNEAGDYGHIVLQGDDYGTQVGPQMPPKLWERFIFPRLKELISFIKKNAKVKVLLHCCGGIRPFIRKLIEAGVDILNPLQPRARGMNRKEIKQEFSGKLIFHGGLDIQYVLPRGTVEEVENEVKDVIETYAPGGEYIFSPAHNIQADVPPENVLAAYRAALRYGRFHK